MHKLLSLLLLIFAFVPSSADTADELTVIRRQYAEAVLHKPVATDSVLADFVRDTHKEPDASDQIVLQLSRLYPPEKGQIGKLLQTMRPDGSWTDIDYADTRRSSWTPRQHAERALLLARLYLTDDTPYYHNDTILTAYRRAINFWATARPKSRNWWHNEIGVPKTLGDSYMLMRDYMTPDDLRGAIDVLNASRIYGTGQNRVWLAGVVMVRAILQGDTALARTARDTILEQLTLGHKEGIQPDWSFHQHGSQQQFGNYGLAFIADMSFYARVLQGTSFALSNGQRHILERLMTEGYRWIIWHRRMDVSSVDRQLFNNAQVNKAYSVAFSAQNLGLPGYPLHGNDLVGHRHFPCSDYTIHRRPTWMASVKMASNRVIGTEYVNEDNCLGFYLADGATYYYVRGDEYTNVFPLWDWRCIPGTTTPVMPSGYMPDARHDDSRNHTDNVWGATIGNTGMTAMEINRLGTHARKAWIFTDKYVLCLGAGIRSDSTATLQTCVDQRNATGALVKLSAGHYHHDRTGYIIAPANISTFCGHRKGNWADNMGSYKNFPAEGDVMQITLRHSNTDRREGSYMYAVMPDCSPKDAARFDLKKEVIVIRNDNKAQIVTLRCLPGIVWVAAYEAGTYSIGGKQIEIDKPGIYVYKKGTTKCIQKS